MTFILQWFRNTHLACISKWFLPIFYLRVTSLNDHKQNGISTSNNWFSLYDIGMSVLAVRSVRLFASTSARTKSDSAFDRLERTICTYVRISVRPGQINFPGHARACPAAAAPSSHGCAPCDMTHPEITGRLLHRAPRPTRGPWTYRSVHQKCGRRAGQARNLPLPPAPHSLSPILTRSVNPAELSLHDGRNTIASDLNRNIM